MKRALAFIGAIGSAQLYVVITICLIPFATAIWSLVCVARGLEWARERVA